jgi:arginase family enzyme
VVIYSTVPVETDAKIAEAVKKILAKKAFPVILGGDHSHSRV